MGRRSGKWYNKELAVGGMCGIDKINPAEDRAFVDSMQMIMKKYAKGKKKAQIVRPKVFRPLVKKISPVTWTSAEAGWLLLWLRVHAPRSLRTILLLNRALKAILRYNECGAIERD